MEFADRGILKADADSKQAWSPLYTARIAKAGK
jgi:hypothetical protein